MQSRSVVDAMLLHLFGIVPPPSGRIAFTSRYETTIGGHSIAPKAANAKVRNRQMISRPIIL